MTKIRTAFYALFYALALSVSAHAATVLPLGLERLHGDAKLIFLGECLTNSVQLDQQSGRVVTFTTFEVLETFKGNLGRSHTIKQIGGNLPEGGLSVKIPGVPQFEVGKRYVVFLPPASDLGFSSPVGLNQGMFTLKTDARGAQTASNGRDVGELMENIPSKMPTRVASKLSSLSKKELPANAKARAEIHLDDLRTILRGMQ